MEVILSFLIPAVVLITISLDGLNTLNLESTLECIFNENIDQDFMEFAKSEGYYAESHAVVTEDGYKLTLHRLLNPKNQRKACPILLGHGLFLTAFDYIILKNASIAVMLANAGYDVWLYNLRGNYYSQNHTRLNKEDDPFWDFTLHESGIYDLPASIDYILKETGSSSIHYLGYNSGAVLLHILMDHKPEYNDKVCFIVFLAPAPIVKNIASPLVKALLPFYVKGNVHGEFFIDPNDPKHELVNLICRLDAVVPVCETPIIALNGKGQWDKCLIPVIAGHSLGGTSKLTVSHYCQFADSGLFRRFNYGTQRNLAEYDSQEPPLYDFSKLNKSISVFYGKGDILVVIEDIKTYIKTMGTKIVYSKMVDDSTFTHLDMVYGKNTHSLVYQDVIELFNNHTCC